MNIEQLIMGDSAPMRGSRIELNSNRSSISLATKLRLFIPTLFIVHSRIILSRLVGIFILHY